MTHYRGIQKIYFDAILKALVKVGGLNSADRKILDFGCGTQQLKTFLTNQKYVGYDIVPEYSDVKDWDQVDFNIFVTNETFYEMPSADVEKILIKLSSLKPDCQLLFGISRQGWLNKVGSFFLEKQALAKTLTLPATEKLIINKFCTIVKKKTVFGLCDIYLAKFKNC
ncbi:MAG: class I SAM-dependent methyltransferase [Patescibacteria group bacterium]|nr:class I SAM-dependent methyltransferase [Patescibacteria group bacterium]